MNRRNVMMTLSGAVATSALMAVPRLARAQTTSATIAMASPDATPVPGAVIDLQTYVTDTLTLGGFSREASVLAETRAFHPKVREFARFEVAEQTAMAQVLTDNTTPPPSPLYGLDADILASLRNSADPDFDMAYVRAQIDGHARLRQMQQAFLNGDPNNRNYEHIAVLARTVIEMHQTMLMDLLNQLTA